MVNVEVTVENVGAASRNANLRVRLIDDTGVVSGEAQVPVTVAAVAKSTVTCEVKLSHPKLWSPADPELYRAEVAIESAKKVEDVARLQIGVRKVAVDAEGGLRINGEPLKLQGGCVHHDNGILESACIPRAEERRVETLKESGYNAIRTSHNPPSRDFLDACDRLGMVVIDEVFDCWEKGNKNPQDYHLYFKDWWQRDMEAMIIRDRNHPSVVFWSIGNEINERGATRDRDWQGAACGCAQTGPDAAGDGGNLRIMGSRGQEVGRYAAGVHLSGRGWLQLHVEGVREGPRKVHRARDDGHGVFPKRGVPELDGG
jgi:beta-galactosidase